MARPAGSMLSPSKLVFLHAFGYNGGDILFYPENAGLQSFKDPNFSTYYVSEQSSSTSGMGSKYSCCKSTNTVTTSHEVKSDAVRFEQCCNVPATHDPLGVGINLSFGLNSVAAGPGCTCLTMLTGEVACSPLCLFNQKTPQWTPLADYKDYFEIKPNMYSEAVPVIDIALTERLACAVAGYNSDSLYCVGLAGVTSTDNLVDLMPYLDLGTTYIAQISVGPQAACVLTSDGRVKCFGIAVGASNSPTSFGMRDPVDIATAPFAEYRTAAAVTHVTVGRGYHCVLFVNGRIQCLGRDDDQIGSLGTGALYYSGLGTFNGSPTPNASVVPYLAFSDLTAATVVRASDWGTTCALFTNKRVRCWGRDYGFNQGYEGAYAATGAGNSLVPLISVPYINFPATIASIILDIDISTQHSCATLTGTVNEENKYVCWGEGENKRLGYGTTTDWGTTVTANKMTALSAAFMTGNTKGYTVFPVVHPIINVNSLTRRSYLWMATLRANTVTQVQLRDIVNTGSFITLPCVSLHAGMCVFEVPSWPHVVNTDNPKIGSLNRVLKTSLSVADGTAIFTATGLHLVFTAITTVTRVAGSVGGLHSGGAIIRFSSLDLTAVAGLTMLHCVLRNGGEIRVQARWSSAQVGLMFCDPLPAVDPGYFTDDIADVLLSLGPGFATVAMGTFQFYSPVLVKPSIGAIPQSSTKLTITITGAPSPQLPAGDLVVYFSSERHNLFTASAGTYISESIISVSTPGLLHITEVPPYQIDVLATLNGQSGQTFGFADGKRHYVYRAPVIGSLLPPQIFGAGTGLHTITIAGTNFLNTATTFNDFAPLAVSPLVVSFGTNKYTATSPASDPGLLVFTGEFTTSSSVQVSLDGGQTFSAGMDLRVINPSFIGVFPMGIPTGMSGEQVTLSEWFHVVADRVVASFDPARVVWDAPVSVSTYHYSFEIPTAAAPASPPLSLSFTEGASYATLVPQFHFYSAVVTAVFPKVIPTVPATTGLRITIYGSGFPPIAGPKCLSGGEVPTTGFQVSSTVIECMAPSRLSGNVTLEVAFNQKHWYTVPGGPALTLFSVARVFPSIISMNSASTISVFGAHFPYAPAATCLIGTFVPLAATVLRPAVLVCNVPAGYTAMPTSPEIQVSFDVLPVFDNAQASPKSSSSMTIAKHTLSILPDPVVTALIPSRTAPGRTVTIYGTNFPFSSVSTFPSITRGVKVGDKVVSRLAITYVLAGSPSFVITVPNGSGNQPVQVSLNDIFYSPATLELSYLNVNFVRPELAPRTPVISLNLIGRDLGNSAKGGTPACFFTQASRTAVANAVSASTVRCDLSITPLFTPGVYDMAYRNDPQLGAGVATPTDAKLTLYMPPTLSSTSLTPVRILRTFPETPSARLTITGSNFHTGGPAGFVKCQFTAGALNIVTEAESISASQVRCFPPSASGDMDVSVSFNFGISWHAVPSAKVTFILLNALDPPLGLVGGGAKVSMFGSTGVVAVAKSACVSTNAGGSASGGIAPLATGIVQCTVPAAFGKAAGPATLEYQYDDVTIPTNSGLQFYYYPEPKITAVIPVSVAGSDPTPVTVYGTGFIVPAPFGSVARVACRFGEISARADPDVGILTLAAPAPPGSHAVVCTPARGLGAAPVDISLNNGNQFSSVGFPFRFYSVFSLTPASGPASGETTIIVSGTGFVDAPPNTSILCHYRSTSSGVQLALVNATRLSDVRLTCQSPSLSVPSVFVEVSFWAQAGGVSYDRAPFTIYGTPVITAIAPLAMPLGSTSTKVTVFGFNFRTDPGLRCRVGDDVSPTADFDTGTGAVVCNLPSPRRLGGNRISVSLNRGFTYTTENSVFHYIKLTSLSPTVSTVLGNVVVTIEGEGFNALADGVATSALCRFGASNFALPTATVSTQVLCSVPTVTAALIGNHNVEFSIDGTLFTNDLLGFTYIAVPNVTALAPTAGPSSGNFTVSLFGHFFSVGPTLENVCIFDGVDLVPAGPVKVQSTVVVNATYSYVTWVPAAASVTGATLALLECLSPPRDGIRRIEISHNGGVESTNAGLLMRYFSVASLNPDAGPAGAEVEIVLFGSNLIVVPGASRCVFGTVSTPAFSIGADQAKCTSPRLGSGSYVVEFTGDGVSFSADGRTYNSYPVVTVTAVNPPGGPSVGGTQCAIYGTGFFKPASLEVIKCRFGAVPVNPRSYIMSGTQVVGLVCVTPSGIGPRFAELSFNGGFTYTANERIFYYFQVLGAFPNKGPTLGGTAVIIEGTGFDEAIFSKGDNTTNRCMFGTLRGAYSYLDSSRLQCTAPAQAEGEYDLSFSLATGISAAGVVSYTYYVQSNFSRIVPLHGVSSGGTLVTLSPTSTLPSDTVSCKFDITVVPGIIFSTRAGVRISCVTPPGSGNAALQVSFNSVDYLESARFQYFSGSLSTPLSSPSSGAAVVTVLGTGFQNFPGINCKFGNLMAAEARYVSPERIDCKVPFFGATVAGAAQNHPQANLFGNETAPANATRVLRRSLGDGDFSAAMKLRRVALGDLGRVASLGSGAPVVPSVSGTTLPLGSSSGDGLGVEDARMDADESHALSAPHRTALAFSRALDVSVTLDGIEWSGGPSLTLYLYDSVKVTAFLPSSSPTAGGEIITIYGSNFIVGAESPLCNFGDDTVFAPATILNTTALTCVTTPHVEDPAVIVSVSMNGQNFDQASEGVFFSYEVCRKGTFAVSPKDKCTPCGPGYYSDQQGARECIICPSTSYASGEINPTCEPCPDFSFIEGLLRDSRDKCTCNRGYYPPIMTDGGECLPCPQGATCQGGPNPPVGLPGWWTENEADPGKEEIFVYVRCDNPDACPGGVGSNICAEGYGGRQCADCLPTYYKAGTLCRKCPESSILTIVFFLLFCLIVCFLLFRMVGSEASAYGGTIGIATYFFQIVSVLSKVDLKWPSDVQRTMALMSSPFSLNVDVLASECSVPDMGFAKKWLAIMLLPFFFGFLFTFVYLCSKVVGLCKKKADSSIKRAQQAHIGDGLVNAFCLFMSLAYLTLVNNSFQLFDCTEAEDGSITLDAQPSLICYDSWWWKLAPVAALGVVGFGFITPAVLGVFLYRSRKLLETPKILGRFGAVYVDYRFSAFYWEIMMMIEKFFISVSLTFFTTFTSVQILAFLLVCMMGLSNHITTKPFFVNRYNKLQTILRWCACIMIMSGMLFLSGNFPTKEMRLTTTALVFFILFLSSTLVIFIIFYDIITIRRSLSNAKFDKETSLRIVKLITPQGKTLILEWMGSNVAEEVKETIVRTLRNVSDYYESQDFQEVADTASDNGNDILDKIFHIYTRRMFQTPVVPAVRLWFLRRMATAKITGNIEACEDLHAFIRMFSEVSRYIVFNSLGANVKMIASSKETLIPWLDEISLMREKGELVDNGREIDLEDIMKVNKGDVEYSNSESEDAEEEEETQAVATVSAKDLKKAEKERQKKERQLAKLREKEKKRRRKLGLPEYSEEYDYEEKDWNSLFVDVFQGDFTTKRKIKVRKGEKQKMISKNNSETNKDNNNNNNNNNNKSNVIDSDSDSSSS